jgi:hypothetical protein
MYIAFETLPKESKVWIYQSDKEFNTSDKSYIDDTLTNFCLSWESHGKAINASYRISNDRFIILAADCNSEVSGCSIDKSVNIIKEIEKHLEIKLLDRTFVIIESDKIFQLSIAEIKKELKEGNLSPETIIFNNSVITLSEMKHDWRIPIKKSWLSKFIKQ